MSQVVSHDVANIMIIENGIVRALRWRGYKEYLGTEAYIASVEFKIDDMPNLREMRKKIPRHCSPFAGV